MGRINFNKSGTTWFHSKFDPIDNPIDPIESLYTKHLVIVTIKALKKQSLKQYCNNSFYSTHDASHRLLKLLLKVHFVIVDGFSGISFFFSLIIGFS